MNFNSAGDLIADESFLAWVYKTDKGGTTAKWDQWIAGNPDKKQFAEEAVALLQQLQIKENPVSAGQLAAAEARLMKTINIEKESQPAKLVPIESRKIWYAVAAAAIIAMTFFGIKYYAAGLPAPQLATAYGQIKQEKLPDGTEVFLNANSNIAYKNEWKEGTDREVWINGEAFFHVKKTAHKDKFTVHTDAFDIYRWTRQALGLPGLLFGWSPWINKKIQKQAREGLEKFMNS